MNLRYFLARYRQYRMEYLAAPRTRLRTDWLWPFHILLHVITYPLRGDIARRKYLRHAAAQQADTIAMGNFKSPAQLFETPLRLRDYCTRPIQLVHATLQKFRRLFVLQTCRLEIADWLVGDSAGQHPSGWLLIPNRESIPIPQGLVFFRYLLSDTTKLVDLTVCFDVGVGFSHEQSIPLPVADSATYEFLLDVPVSCQHILFAAAGGLDGLEIDSVSLKETNIFHGAWYLHKNRDLGLFTALHAVFERRLPWIRSPRLGGTSYAEWLNTQASLGSSDLMTIDTRIEQLQIRPKLSLITNIDDDNRAFLDQTLSGVRAQYYPDWELLLWASIPPDGATKKLIEQTSALDPRIRFISTSEKPESEQTVLSEANGTFLGFLQCGDLLSAHALYLVADAINRQKSALLFYTDNDRIDDRGIRSEPFFKPAWNYDFFIGKDYLKHIAFFHTPKVKALCRKITGHPISDNELALRFIENLDETKIVRIPFVLYHRRSTSMLSKTTLSHAGRERCSAIESHFSRTSQIAKVSNSPLWPNCIYVQRPVADPKPLVSIIVLTRDKCNLLTSCVTGLLEKTNYKNVEIIIVDNGSNEESTLRYLDAIESDARVTVLRRPEEFNFSALNNHAIDRANGEYIGLVNNDIAVIDPDWLTEIISHLARPKVGVVGPKLLYSDDTIQHAGVVIGLGGIAGHAFRHFPRYSSYRNNRMAITQRVSCVTGACLFTKRGIFTEIGGLDAANLKVAFNDVDYCLEAQARGYAIMWTPFAELYHLESASRGSDLTMDNLERWRSEYAFMKKKWTSALHEDIYYSPSLTVRDEDLSLAYPARAKKPWSTSIDADRAEARG